MNYIHSVAVLTFILLRRASLVCRGRLSQETTVLASLHSCLNSISTASQKVDQVLFLLSSTTYVSHLLSMKLVSDSHLLPPLNGSLRYSLTYLFSPKALGNNITDSIKCGIYTLLRKEKISAFL